MPLEQFKPPEDLPPVTPNDGGLGSHKSAREAQLEDEKKTLELKLAAAELKNQKSEEKDESREMIKSLRDQATAFSEWAMKQESQPRGKGQTIKVEPKLNWPTLSDANTGGRDVEEFYERFEEMVGLANNATGMRQSGLRVSM